MLWIRRCYGLEGVPGVLSGEGRIGSVVIRMGGSIMWLGMNSGVSFPLVVQLGERDASGN